MQDFASLFRYELRLYNNSVHVENVFRAIDLLLLALFSITDHD